MNSLAEILHAIDDNISIIKSSSGTSRISVVISKLNNLHLLLTKHTSANARQADRAILLAINDLKSARNALQNYLETSAELKRRINEVSGESLTNCDSTDNIIDGTIEVGEYVTRNGLRHSFDRHAVQWFGYNPSWNNHGDEWSALIERASNSKKSVKWSTGPTETIGHLARIEGRNIFVQFRVDTGELATAFVPNKKQLRAIERALKGARS